MPQSYLFTYLLTYLLTVFYVSECNSLVFYTTADEADAYMFYRCFFIYFLFYFLFFVFFLLFVFFRPPQKYQTIVLGNG